MVLPAEDRSGYSIGRAVEEVSKLGAGGLFGLSGLFGSARAFFLASLYKTLRRPILAVLPTEEAAEGFSSDLKFFLGKGEEGSVFFYPSTEVLPFEALPVHQEILSSRVELLFKLLDETPFITVSSAPNLMQSVLPRKGLAERAVSIRVEGEFPRDSLVGSLLEMGYMRVAMVEGGGEMSVRGGIGGRLPTASASPPVVGVSAGWV